MCEVVLAENRPIRSSFCSSYSCSVTVGEKRNCRGGGGKGRMGRSGEWLGSSLPISLRGQPLAVTTLVSISTIRFTSHTHTTIFHTTTLSHITPQPSQEHTPTCHTTHSQSLHIHYPTPPHTDTLSLPTSLNSSSSRTWSPLISALSKKSTMVSSNTSSYTSAGVGETESQGPLPAQHSTVVNRQAGSTIGNSTPQTGSGYTPL